MRDNPALRQEYGDDMEQWLASTGRALKRGCGAVLVFLFSDLLSAHGRIGRVKLLAIASLAWWPVVLVAFLVDWLNAPTWVEYPAMLVAFLYLLFAVAGAAARRLHDLGRSGGWFVLAKPLWAILVSAPGQPQENEYGPPPNDSAAWYLGFLFWPLLFAAQLLYEVINPLDKTLVMHNHSGRDFDMFYRVGEAWGDSKRAKCCVRIQGDPLMVRWRTRRTPDYHTEVVTHLNPKLLVYTPGHHILVYQDQWVRTIDTDDHERQVANPPRQPDETFLHVHFLPDNEVRLAWSRDARSPLAAEMAEAGW